MKNYYDDFDGFNNKRHREVVSKKNEYEDEYELDALHIVADDISEKSYISLSLYPFTRCLCRRNVRYFRRYSKRN